MIYELQRLEIFGHMEASIYCVLVGFTPLVADGDETTLDPEHYFLEEFQSSAGGRKSLEQGTDLHDEVVLLSSPK
jgi:hypothetical protein